MAQEVLKKYGYDTAHQDGGGYRLKDREASIALRDRVLSPLSTLPVGSRVINLGCGDGNLERYAGPRRPYDFISVDLEPGGVNSVNRIFLEQERTGKDLAVVGDISRLDKVSGVADQHFAAGVSWRVIHSLPGELHVPVFEQVHNRLSDGAHFYVAVASDQDWKVEALGEDYTPSATNDCSGVMFRDYGVNREHVFPIQFFSKDELARLAAETGFVVNGTITSFDEPSGYPHLQHTDNRYLFADLIKPEASLNGYNPKATVVYSVEENVA